ncbi:hypothetical protein KGD82_16520 [Nocardiopsis eucommiae]|uniref:Uncharacterized protein n=1 Tax=Nocardiopsis eucommiae TaxID=2831970 RepID=A0A975QJG3_9ACTN|nr:hypothetical protein KGD82_16520 [Nocardiopsis eucommiae]
MIQPVTLIEYARTRDIDPTQLLTQFTDNPDALPEQVGTRAGQPTYDPDELDRARGVTTLEGFARYRHRDVQDVRRWPKLQPVLWPKPVGKIVTGKAGKPAQLFELARLDQVAAAEAARTQREGVSDDHVTLAGFSDRTGVPVRTLRDTWKPRYPDKFPKPVVGPDGRPLKEGRAYLFEFEELERFRLWMSE